MALVFGAIFGACWIVAFMGTRERSDLPEPEKITLKFWLSVFANKAYRNFLGIFLSFQIAVDLVLALFIFYIDIVVLQYKNYELIVGLLLVCSMLLMTVMSAIAKRKGKAFPLYIGIPVWMLSMV
jgi:Na+/melibiose symporter-like transporter